MTEDAKMPWATFAQLILCSAAGAKHKQHLMVTNMVTCNVLCTSLTNALSDGCAMQITDIADAENKWTYLEASDQGYHLYIRHGFEVLEELRVTPDAPVMLGMGRPPH